MDINWIIERLDCIPNSEQGENYVVIAYWRCNASEDGHFATAYGSCSFAVESKDDFIHYDSLTEEVVLGWVWSNGVDKDAAETSMAQQIDQQKNPPIASLPLPWLPVIEQGN